MESDLSPLRSHQISRNMAMNNVIQFPGKPIPAADQGIELALRQMELIMAGQRHSAEFQQINDEICPRQARPGLRFAAL